MSTTPDTPGVIPPLPVPVVIEDDSETAWLTWDYWQRQPINGGVVPVNSGDRVLPGPHIFIGLLESPLRREAQPESSHRLGGSAKAAAQPSL